MGVHHVSSRPHAKENPVPQRHITGGKNGDILGFKIRYYTGYHVQMRKNSLWKNLCGKKCDPVFPIANACAVLSHERLFRCVGFSLHWHSQDRAATSRRNRVQLKNLLRLRLCHGAQPVARPRGARGDLVPRRGCEFAFSHPPSICKKRANAKLYKMV